MEINVINKPEEPSASVAHAAIFQEKMIRPIYVDDTVKILIAALTQDRLSRQTVAVALDGLRFPPNDLQQSLSQQTMVLEAAREAAHGVSLPRSGPARRRPSLCSG